MVRSRPRPAVVAVALLAAGCGGEGGDARMATTCMQASDDNRVRLSASLATDVEVRTDGDAVAVHARVPVGIGLDARVRWREWRYRCRRTANGMEFLGYTTTEAGR